MAFQSPSQKDLFHEIIFHADVRVRDAWIGCTEETRMIQVPQLLLLQPGVQLGVRVPQSARASMT